MRFATLLAVFGTVAAVSAGTVNLVRRQLPTCADPCIANADYGSCSSTDDACLCKSSAFVDSVTSCIESSCTGSDLTNAEAAAQQLCLAVGVTLTATPTSSATGSSAPSASNTSPATSSGSPSPSASTTTNGALTHGAPALAGLFAVAAIALNL